MSYRFAESLLAGAFAPAHKLCQQLAHGMLKQHRFREEIVDNKIAIFFPPNNF
jgi:hypothetical protein